MKLKDEYTLRLETLWLRTDASVAQPGRFPQSREPESGRLVTAFQESGRSRVQTPPEAPYFS